MLHDFTEDIDSLRARIANADLNPQGEQIDNKGMGDTPLGDRALSEMNQVVRDRKLEVTLAGLEALGNHLAGMPGRKNLVWITSGLPFESRPMDGQSSTRTLFSRPLDASPRKALPSILSTQKV